MRLLITGAWAEARAHFPAIQALGHEIRFLQQEAEALPWDPAWVEGVVCNGLFLHHPLEDFPALRYIQLTSAGFDRIDLEAARARGIQVRNARGVYSVPMAEHALGGVLQLLRRAAWFRAGQQAHRWEKRRDLEELWGKTVVILGCGSVGTACAARFAAFGCRVLGIDLFPRAAAEYEAIYGLDRLDALLPQADAAVLTLPLTEDTRGLLSRDRLGRMKPGAIVVNLARGALVDQDALTEALRAGALGGAVLDVFDPEPLAPDSPLWDLEQVILTPHNSFVGSGNSARLAARILEGLSAL